MCHGEAERLVAPAHSHLICRVASHEQPKPADFDPEPARPLLDGLNRRFRKWLSHPQDFAHANPERYPDRRASHRVRSQYREVALCLFRDLYIGPTEDVSTLSESRRVLAGITRGSSAPATGPQALA